MLVEGASVVSHSNAMSCRRVPPLSGERPVRELCTEEGACAICHVPVCCEQQVVNMAEWQRSHQRAVVKVRGSAAGYGCATASMERASYRRRELAGGGPQSTARGCAPGHTWMSRDWTLWGHKNPLPPPSRLLLGAAQEGCEGLLPPL